MWVVAHPSAASITALNDSWRLRSEPGYASLIEGVPMKSTSLVACLLVAAGLSTASLTVQAADAPQQTVKPSNISTRDLKVGDRAPDILARKESAIADWKKHGLKQPDDDSQWARVNDKYVMVKITNGTILDITPVKK
jgi:Ni/Co efflux regulator RcnB